ncbi:helix-turn-helix domain-containing protein [Streptomyces sp. NPDC051940]|uniref:AraC family transcriptional regulator n=1 Tax=Streptomyces sp. NPDC051940 TaxID=3155675 RepID=UPI003420EDE7
MTESDHPRGVLHPDEQARVATVRQHPPGARAAAFVEFYWHVAWHVAGPAPYETKVLSHPNVHLVFEEPEPLVYGVDRGLFTRRLEGDGQVLGIKFRPGAFRAFTDGPVSALADRRVPAVEFFGAAVAGASREILALRDGAAMARAAEDFLRGRLPDDPDPAAVQADQAVRLAAGDTSLVRVDQLAGATGLSVRGLQRLFAEYVGASPKWVLRRARLHEAAARADAGAGVDWAGLAADLGYADQAHFTRDFTAAVGVAPTRYAA